jgi:hypothetical protein
MQNSSWTLLYFAGSIQPYNNIELKIAFGIKSVNKSKCFYRKFFLDCYTNFLKKTTLWITLMFNRIFVAEWSKMSRFAGYVNQIICGDAAEILCEIPSDSVNLDITSPPYYKQRDYGSEGIGNEKSVEEYINNLIEIFKEYVRIVKSTGAVVFNIV